MDKYSLYGITLETLVVMFGFFLVFGCLAVYGFIYMRKVRKQ
ncbi:hypothetical protein SAMN03159341_101164 [Paenibacillus sp. 1_12]|nr:hypothetical protein SAMN03159341_101164 [Paenibacillus sp. 1_12]